MYYFDSINSCNKDIITLTPGQTVTIKKTSVSSSLITGQEKEKCSITFRSNTGFDISFSKGVINDCGVTVKIHTGTNKYYSKTMVSATLLES